MCDDGAWKAGRDGFGDFGGVWVEDGAGEADGFEGLCVIVEFDEIGGAGWVAGGECFVESVIAAVEAGASV